MKLKTVIFALGLVTATAGFGQGLYLEAKAWLAQVLIAQSWADELATGEHHTPWPWADTYPVAHLSVSELHVKRMVLSGASGRVLAFGPGHIQATALPGQDGISLIAGHRDTHFRFLQQLKLGQHIRIQKADGTIVSYEVVETWVQQQPDMDYLSSLAGNQLVLATCYPFDAIIPGGPQRFLVRAIRM